MWSAFAVQNWHVYIFLSLLILEAQGKSCRGVLIPMCWWILKCCSEWGLDSVFFFLFTMNPAIKAPLPSGSFRAGHGSFYTPPTHFFLREFIAGLTMWVNREACCALRRLYLGVQGEACQEIPFSCGLYQTPESGDMLWLLNAWSTLEMRLPFC